MEKRKIVILDRDGVINVDLPQSLVDIDQLIVIPECAAAFILLTENNYTLLVASNQACVGRGELSIEHLEEINKEINTLLGSYIERFYICPHTDTQNCECRKPKPGLLRQIWEDYSFIPEETWFVGDAERDVQAALDFGCRPALVLTGKGAETHQKLPNVPAFPTLLDFAQALVTGKLI